MKPLSKQYYRSLRVVIPALMLVMFLTSLTVSAFHKHNCDKPDVCAICTFQTSNYTLFDDTAASFGTPFKSVNLPFITLPERVSHPFLTLVFASHAPPQYS